MPDKKERFYKVYANLPLSLRQEIVAIVKDEPVSWQVVKLEVDTNTKLGKTLLKKLDALHFI